MIERGELQEEVQKKGNKKLCLRGCLGVVASVRSKFSQQHVSSRYLKRCLCCRHKRRAMGKREALWLLCLSSDIALVCTLPTRGTSMPARIIAALGAFPSGDIIGENFTSQLFLRRNLMPLI